MDTYQFGQFRRGQASKYTNELQYFLDDYITKSEMSDAIKFQDKAINLTGNNQLQSTDETRTKMHSYFLRYKVYKNADSEQLIKLHLTNTNKTTDNTQKLNQVVVPRGDATEFVTFELVITPNATYNQINFILERLADEYLSITPNPDGTFGRMMNIEIEYCEEIINIIDTYLNPSINNKGQLKQIGIQGPPGTIMSIDGEEIRIGRSGIYEINNGITISFLGVIVHNNDKYFILDYQY